MKITYLCDLPLLAQDAPSLHILEICKNLEIQNHDVTLFAPNIVKFSPHTKFKIIYLPAPFRQITLFYQPILFFYLIFYLINHRPDILFIRQDPFLFLPILLGKIYRIPVITEINGIQEKEIKKAAKYNKAIKIFILLKGVFLLYGIELFTYLFSTKIITVAEGIKKYIVKKYSISADKIIVIQNGVDTKTFRPMNIYKTQKELNLDTKNKYVGFVGGIVKWQGLEYLLKAIPTIIKTIPNARFIIVGEGEFKNELIKLSHELDISQYIYFVGSIPHYMVPKYINSFHVCVSYYTKERNNITSPFKIYEYLACGKSTIISNIDGLKNVFDKIAIVTKAEDTNDLANKIIYALNHNNFRNKLGINSRNYVLNGHSWQNVSCQIEAVLRHESNLI